METTALQTFIAVAESGSFSQAAEQLFLTQPAVSKRVGALEAELGTRLFDRIGRRVRMTEAGRALLPRARRIVTELEDSRRAISRLSGRVEGRLSIGTSHHIGLHHLPPVLRGFSRAFPDVELDIAFLDSEAGCEAVEQGELELAIVTLPPQRPAHLEVEPLWEDPLVAVAGRGHPLAGHEAPTPQTLAAYPAVLPALGTYTRGIVDTAFAQFGLQPSVGLSTNFLETIKMLVSVGLGWSILPRTLLDRELVTLPVAGLRLGRHLGLVRHPAMTLSNAAVAFRDRLRNSRAQEEE